MAVLPELEPVLLMAQVAPPLDFSDLAALRTQSDLQVEAMTGLYVPEAPGVVTEQMTIGECAVRIHRPENDGGTDVLVYIHGGGWILGSAKQTDRICRRLADRTGSVVASVDYRLAPEYPFPIPVEDSYAVAATFAFDGRRVVIGGQSAGGNLAAAVALKARDRGEFTLAGQWLDVPGLDLTLPDDESLAEYGRGYGLDADVIDKSVALYIGEGDRRDPYASPLCAESLEGLAPAVITVAGCDPLASQGERYAQALRAAGVPVRFSRWDGHLHATMSLTTLHPSCQAYEDEVVAGIAEARALSARTS